MGLVGGIVVLLLLVHWCRLRLLLLLQVVVAQVALLLVHGQLLLMLHGHRLRVRMRVHPLLHQPWRLAGRDWRRWLLLVRNHLVQAGAELPVVCLLLLRHSIPSGCLQFCLKTLLSLAAHLFALQRRPLSGLLVESVNLELGASVAD